MADIIVAGNTSGAITISAPLVAGSGTLTLPVATDTLVGKATTDTLTNKSIAATQLTGTIAASALPAGSVLQVVSATTSTATGTTSNSFVSTALTASITPRSASNKVLIQVTGPIDSTASTNQAYGTIYRTSTNLGNGTDGMTQVYGGSSRIIASLAMTFLDSPATTSATSYTVYIRSSGGSNISFPYAGISSIILTEVAG